MQKGKILGYFWKGYTILGNVVANLIFLLPLSNMKTREEAWRYIICHTGWIKLGDRIKVAGS